MSLYTKIIRLRRGNWTTEQIAQQLSLRPLQVAIIELERAPGHKLTEAQVDRLYNGKRYGPAKP